MTDIASFLTQDPSTGGVHIDWMMDGDDLAGDDGLATAVIISLFTDRLAEPDDIIAGAPPSDKAGPPDRRGWWGDLPADPAIPKGPSALTGSRMWLRLGMPANTQTARRVELDAREALQWLIDSAVAQKIDVTTQWVSRDVLGLHVAIWQRKATGRMQAQEYDYVWSPTLALAGISAPIAPPASDVLSQDGGHVLTETGGNLLEEYA